MGVEGRKRTGSDGEPPPASLASSFGLQNPLRGHHSHWVCINTGFQGGM